MLARIGACTRDDITTEMAKRRIDANETLAAPNRLSLLGLVHRERTFNLLLVDHPGTVKQMLIGEDNVG
jgi:hypothetical protein